MHCFTHIHLKKNFTHFYGCKFALACTHTDLRTNYHYGYEFQFWSERSACSSVEVAIKRGILFSFLFLIVPTV